MDLDRINPVSLITGATSGLGRAIARDIARRSEGGLILVDRDEAELDRVADALAADAPERVSMLAFDVADPDRWAQASDFIKSQYGRLDWAFVNADIATLPSAEESDLVDFGRIMPASLDGAMLTLRTLIPLMRTNTQGGAIVVNASAGAIKVEPGAKAGLLHLTRVAAKEGAPEIRVNAIAAGDVEAQLWSALPWFQDIVAETGGERAALEKIAALPAPFIRYAKAGDIKQLVIMLLSDESPITGATLVVDGGYTL